MSQQQPQERLHKRATTCEGRYQTAHNVQVQARRLKGPTGKRLMAALRQVAPDLAAKIMGTEADPSLSDHNTRRFWTALDGCPR